MTIERNETGKTIAFAGVALVLAGLAFFTQPKAAVRGADDVDVGTKFFPDLTLDRIKGLEISVYDKDAARTDVFRVDYEKGGWTLPLKDGYPADAKEALAKATGWLVSATRDVKLTSDKSQFAKFGLLNPTEETGSEGHGILFRALDENKNVVAELVVGKEVEGKTGWRYVREPKGDAVYRADVGEFSVSTRFRDWIEKDLLELSDSVRTLSSSSSFSEDREKAEAERKRSEAEREKYKKDVALLQWTDFTLGRSLPAQVLSKKTETIKITGGSEWSPQAELQGVAPNMETNNDKVRDLLDGLKNLQIVDVVPKPPGLGPDLKMVMKTGQITEEDDLKVRELAARGFIANEEKDVVPTDGELRVETKQGIFYRLRFGKRANISEDGKVLGAVKEDEPDAAKKDGKKDDPKKAVDAKAKDAKKADPAKKSESEKPKEENRFVLIAAGFDESKFPPIPDAPDPKLPETKPGQKPEDKADEAAKKKQLEEIRQLQKMQTEQARKKRDADIQNGKARAKELADRYDRWYYVVSNDTYKKLKIDKAMFSKAKEEKKDDKAGATPSVPGLPGDLSKEGPAPENPNVPKPPAKSDVKKVDAAKDKDAKAGKTDPAKPADKPTPKAESSKTEKPKESPKPASSEKMKESDKAKKPPTP